MSRIPNSAMPHAWADDSPHAEDVRRARGGKDEGPSWLKWAAVAGAAYIGLRLFLGHRSHA